MSEVYLGHLSRRDMLYEYLRWEIFPRFGCDCRNGIRVFGTGGSNAVYIYEDRSSCRKVVGKFFYSDRMKDWELAGQRLRREYDNIREFRSYLGGCHYVADALGCNYDLNRLLVVEYCTGTPMDSVIMQAINNRDDALLYSKLTALAWFLASVHNKSVQGVGVDFNRECRYFSSITGCLSGMISNHEREHLEYLKREWAGDWAMWSDQEVLVHGDATPSNFFFGDGLHVISFDMERVKRTDRVFDVGRLAGELQHFFLRSTGNKYAAEKFIGHFLWEYCCHFPDRRSAFEAVCRRVPFYMGTTLLRIARNGYLDRNYRRQLVNEAFNCLGR